MPAHKGYDPNSYDRPTAIVTAEIRDVHREMADLCLSFSVLCDRMEQCAREVRKCGLKADRQLFQAFLDAGVSPGKCVRFLGAKDENAVYEVVGIDGDGFYMHSLETGGEFHLNVFEKQDLVRKVRTVRRDNWRIKKMPNTNNEAANQKAQDGAIESK